MQFLQLKSLSYNIIIWLNLFHAAPGDYKAVNRTLTFTPNTKRQCVNFTGLEDGINDESDENFTVTLTRGRDNVVLDPDMAVVTINGTTSGMT